ncbi:MAG: DUF975 family protein [Provencibacterium sp.]|jgi:hypothetical protein|nr:DUF975 family protein [Provencibacterium sp.]
MWTREELKRNAKEILRVSYWPAFAASLVLGIANGATAGSRLNLNIDWEDLFYGDLSVLLPILVGGLSISFVISVAFSAFLLQPLEVGSRRFYLEGTQLRFNLGELGYSFSAGRYKNIVLTMFVRKLLIALASLLLVVPGIILSYSYAMVPYILSENPLIPYDRALRLSRDMTRGHKLDMWVLDLSFIGWLLLGSLACGMGVLFVNPYVHATHAQLYLVLRTAALDSGLTSLEELAPPATN